MGLLLKIQRRRANAVICHFPPPLVEKVFKDMTWFYIGSASDALAGVTAIARFPSGATFRNQPVVSGSWAEHAHRPPSVL